jgi:hypothetical protein
MEAGEIKDKRHPVPIAIGSYREEKVEERSDEIPRSGNKREGNQYSVIGSVQDKLIENPADLLV